MKKALAILLALSMVFAAFADEPATNYSVAEFSGSAEFGYKVDLDDAKNGMFNDASAKLKINLLNGGDKSTAAADGVWGELKIKVNTPDALENPGTLAINAKDSSSIAYVDTAKIHFVDGDTAIALNMKKPDLKLADNYDVTGSLAAGFGIEVTTAPIDVNVYVMDNGVEKEKAFGFKANASLKAVEDLTLKGAVAYNVKDEKLAATADASYKIAINEDMAVTPGAEFKMLEDAKALTGKVNFVWGGAETAVDFAGKGTGLTVKYSTAFADKDGKLEISAYDTLFEALKLGVKYGAGVADIAKGTLDAGAAYSTSFDIIDVSLHGGAKFNLAADDVVEEYKYGAKVSTDDVIANTVLAVSYEAGEYKNYKDDKFKDWTKDPKGVITVSAKISL